MMDGDAIILERSDLLYFPTHLASLIEEQPVRREVVVARHSRGTSDANLEVSRPSQTNPQTRHWIHNVPMAPCRLVAVQATRREQAT